MDVVRIIIDVVALRDNDDKLVPKEVAIMDPDANCVNSWIVQPPCSWSEVKPDVQTQNVWYTKNCHGISWEDGELPYESFRQTLINYTEHGSLLYCYGLETQVYLSRLLNREVIYLKQMQCPKLSLLLSFPITSCCFPLHRLARITCALRNVHALSKYLKYNDLHQSLLHSLDSTCDLGVVY
mgnify:CR=1 FL=1